MESAQWERDRQVNSDSSNSAKRGRASARKEIKNVNAYVCVGTLEGREKKQAEGKHEEKARGKKNHINFLNSHCKLCSGLQLMFWPCVYVRVNGQTETILSNHGSSFTLSVTDYFQRTPTISSSI